MYATHNQDIHYVQKVTWLDVYILDRAEPQKQQLDKMDTIQEDVQEEARESSG